jgi:hypothetical protein
MREVKTIEHPKRQDGWRLDIVVVNFAEDSHLQSFTSPLGCCLLKMILALNRLISDKHLYGCSSTFDSNRENQKSEAVSAERGH